MDVRARARRRRRSRARGARSFTSSTPPRGRATPGGAACRCCSTRSAGASSTTSCRKSSACSIRRSTASARQAGDFYPAELSEEIDALNARIYPTVNNGVYRCGFARSQQAYDEAVVALFESLDWLEARLAECRYLCGERATEADWRLFTTLARFDPVYVGLFKCNVRRIADYPNLSRYLKALRGWPGIEETIDYFHIKHHYYESLKFINPTGIVPHGPAGYE